MIISRKVKTIIVLGAVIIVALFFVYFYFFSIRSVKSFGPLKLGDQTPLKVGDVTEYPYRYILESKFYIYAVQKDANYCALEGCGMSGVLVDCMEGWLSADAITARADEYGLKEEDIEAGKSSIIIIADEDQKIVGIYPNYIIQNIPYILKNHRNLSDRFDFCYDIEMSRRL